MRIPILLSLFLARYVQHVYSVGITFTTPSGGSTFPAGPLTISWADNGGNPDMAALTTYTLELIVGGNTQSNAHSIVPAINGTISSGTITTDVPANASQSIQNGFYLKMTSNTSSDNQVINYSDRFTLVNMNGTTEAAYLEGANAAAGDVTNVPEAQYNVIKQQPSTPSSATVILGQPTATSTVLPPQGNPATAAPQPNSAALIAGSIVAVVGLISIIAWILFFFRRLRRKREAAKSNSDFEDGAELMKKDNSGARGASVFLGKTELPAYRSSASLSTSASTPVELHSQHPRYEMPGTDKAVEAPGSSMVYELEGGSNVWEAGDGRRSRGWDPTA